MFLQYNEWLALRSVTKFWTGKTFMISKLHSNIRLNASNILNSMKFKPYINYPQQNLIVRSKLIFTYPSVSLTYTHNFGNSKVKGARSRSTGAEEEKGRVQ